MVVVADAVRPTLSVIVSVTSMDRNEGTTSVATA